MPKSFSSELAEWMASVDKQLSNLSSGNRLDHASLDGTTLYLKGDGQLGRIGRQPDGSNGVHVVKVQPPPQLTAAILTVGEQAGTCLVEWDGRTFDGRRMPLIHGHTEVWAERVAEDWDPTVAPGDAGKRVGSIRDRTGGEVTVALPQAGTWAVWLRAMGADRETAGPWSPVATVEITPLVDTDAIEAELEDARDRIEQAEQELAAGMADRVAEIEHLREVRIPALQEALTTGLDDVYREAQQYAESQADNAVNQAAANAQSEYDRLQEIAERALSRAGDNVLEDPSFETDYWFDQFDWVASRTFTPSSLARTGDQAMVVSAGNLANLTFDTIDVEPDDSWRLSIWYRTEGSPNLDGTMLRFRDGSNIAVSLASSTDFEQVGEYTRAVVTFTVPEGVSSLNAILRANFSTGSLIIDDVSLQEVGAAAEALRMAEVARQQAEAAHVAAGNAVDAAALAYDAASSKNSIHWSLSAPSGTADNTDDIWWQYELRNGRRVVIGQWFWDNGVWRETEIAEEWLPAVNIGGGTYGSLHGDRLEANTVKAGALAIMPDSQDFAPDLVNHADMWTLSDDVSVASSNAAENGLALRVAGDASSVSGRAYGPWIPAKAGDTIRYSFNVGSYTTTPDGVLRIYFLFDESLTVGWARVEQVTSSGTYEGTLTVPSGVTNSVAFGVNIDTPATNGGAWAVRDFDVRKQVRGVLIEPEGIKSPQVDTEEFFAAEAVIQKVWTEIVRARMVQTQGLITEDMIATGAITTPKLTVTEEMVGEVAKLIRIEAGSLASNDIEAMRIVSSLIEATTYLIHNADGDVSVRLDGVDNYLAGRIHAGMDEDRGIELDYELIEVDDDTNGTDPGDGDESEATHQIVTPYLRFRTSHNHRQIPRMWVGTEGNLNLNPGRVGTSGQNATPFRIWGEAQANVIRAVRFTVPTSGVSGGMFRDGDRTRITGRAPDWSHQLGMFTPGSLGPYSPVSGQYRGTMTWSTPTPSGIRNPIANARMSSTSMDNWRSATATTQVGSSSGFGFTLVSSSTSTNMWLDYNANWV